MKKLGILLFVVFLGLPALSPAATNEDIAAENAELKSRVNEQELAEIKSMLMKQKETEVLDPATKTDRKPVGVSTLTEDDIVKISDLVREKDGKKGVWSGLDIQLYGYFKADASYDDSRVNTGNFATWVESEENVSNDDQFNMTAKQTRLGFRVTGPETEDMITSGRAEIDFYGSAGAENKGNVLLRHAYLKLDWPDDNFNIIAGQTSDVISPLVPSTVNYSVAWWAGNIGYRRPQIRLTKGYDLGTDASLKLEGAITRNIGDNTLVNTESGEDSGKPAYQGRVSSTFYVLPYKPTTVGFSGHYGEEEYDINTRGSHKDFESWSLNLDVTQPVNEWLTFKGEMFTGQNLNQYLGSIGQSVKNNNLEDIRSSGGWLAASMGPWDNWRFNAGFSMEDVQRSDLSVGDRSMNSSIFGNMVYAINKNTDWAFEVSRWRTDYKGQRDGDAYRFQTAFIYKF